MCSRDRSLHLTTLHGLRRRECDVVVRHHAQLQISSQLQACPDHYRQRARISPSHFIAATKLSCCKMQRQWRRSTLPSCGICRATCLSPHLASKLWRCTWRRYLSIVAACKRATSHRTGLTSPLCKIRDGHCRTFLELPVNPHHKHAGNLTACLPHSPLCNSRAPNMVPLGKPFGRLDAVTMLALCFIC